MPRKINVYYLGKVYFIFRCKVVYKYHKILYKKHKTKDENGF